METTPICWIENEDKLDEFIDELSNNNVKEIAIDVEHHHLRSFAGITCLIQMSTKHAD